MTTTRTSTASRLSPLLLQLDRISFRPKPHSALCEQRFNSNCTRKRGNQSMQQYGHGVCKRQRLAANTTYTLHTLHEPHLCSTTRRSSLAVNVVVSMKRRFSILTPALIGLENHLIKISLMS